MEENVALDSTKQKKFVKSIKGIKKLIKKKDADPKGKESQEDKVKSGRVGKKKRPDRGLVYLAHIPHGFYEHEMTQYFKQFGVVTNARVIKSKRTGRSKGYAFVQFKEPAVAQIVAETMNNYLMGKRLIKASYIEPEKQKRRAFRRHWNSVNNPGNNLRMKMKKEHNKNRDEKGDLKRAKQLLANINKTKKKLRELGINYDFFTPVDMPEALVNKNQVRVKNEENEEIITVSDKKAKKNKKEEVSVVKDKKTVTKKGNKVNKIESKIIMESVTKTNAAVIKEPLKKTEKNKPQEVDKSTQKQKKKNLKDKGVTPLEDFIKIKEDSEDSDSSLDFDSDEYEKMMEQDDDDGSEASGDEGESDDEGDDSENVESDDDESEIELPKKKAPVQQQLKKMGKQKTSQQKMSQQKIPQQKMPQPQKGKRKAPQNAQSPKMHKFEKQSNQKPRNKQFKKKK